MRELMGEMPDSVSGSLRLGAQQPSKDSAADCPRVARRGCYSLLTNTASSRIRNRRNRNPSWKFGFRIGLFCAHAIIETSKETYKNRNSLTCLKMSVSISSRHGVRKQRFLPGPSFLAADHVLLVLSSKPKHHNQQGLP